MFPVKCVHKQMLTFSNIKVIGVRRSRNHVMAILLTPVTFCSARKQCKYDIHPETFKLNR